MARLLVATLLVWGALAMPVSASPIGLEFLFAVHGTVLGVGTPPPVIPVPLGTPLRFTLTLDTETPNLCGEGSPFGTYLIGASGLGNTASLDFLGAHYTLAGRVEVGTQLGDCSLGTPSTQPIVRLVVAEAALTDPGGMLVRWPTSPLLGTFTLGGGAASGVGKLFAPTPGTGPASLGADGTGLQVESGTLSITPVTPVPEPGTLGMLGLGLLALGARGWWT